MPINAKISKPTGRFRRKLRVRRKIQGTPQRPRLTVYRSLRHIYAQIVDDTQGHTLVSASTVEPELRGEGNRRNKDAAREVGRTIAQRARAAGIERVVFDRNGYLYHGCVAEVADGAREGELEL